MARINLLPWREKERERKNREFYVQIIAVALFSLLAAFAVWTFFNTQLENQQEANDVVKQANVALDRDLEEIKELEKTKEDIIQRMKVIQDLQGTRPIPVHLFDSLVRVMPENVFLNKISLEKDTLTLYGRANNPNTVSDLLRNMDKTKWLDNSAVKQIKNVIPESAKTEKDKDGNIIVTEEPAPEAEFIKFVMMSTVNRENITESKIEANSQPQTNKAVNNKQPTEKKEGK